MKKPMILAGRDDGFGERMRAFLNALYVSKKYDLEFGFVWRDVSGINYCDDAVKTPFANLPKREELFSKEYIDRYFRKDLTYSYYTPVLDSHYRKSIDNLFEEPFETEWGWYMTQADLDKYFIDVDSNEYRRELVECFKSIGFNDTIKEMFAQVEETTKVFGDFVAIHIRGGEEMYNRNYINIWWHCRYKFMPYPAAVALAIEHLEKGENIVFFGDNFNVLENLKGYLSRYVKERQIDCENRIFIASDYGKELEGGQKTFYDVMLMSHAKFIFCSLTTGFARFACNISNNKLFSLQEYYTTTKIYEAMIKYIDIAEIDSRAKSFAYFFLYVLARELNLPFDAKWDYLQNSFKLVSSGNTRIFMIDTLLEYGKIGEAEEMIASFSLEDRAEMVRILTDNLHNPTIPFDVYKRYFIDVGYKNISKIACEIFIFFSDKDSQVNFQHPGFREHILNLFHNTFDLNLVALPKNNNLYQIPKKHCLSYILGQVMIENSRSFMGYIRMPYVLSYVKEKYFIELAKIKSSGQSCQFYENEEKTLSFQLGEALKRAHKSWYKGGYIKLIFFDVPKLKKEFRERKNNGFPL
ncbi:capsule biosynthesis protein CapA [Campylobacter helveticus]|uniref:capsule biosynthesis protein CapA n=1 Tax=Campylobacter helveticus TaxID=28898 RepID=UPI0010513AAA|nr:capsule biosynthesis protein CapA [Campylobacter helveticus]QBL11986.1 capsule biosynthesis protein CapA [Campylobacter helveticus]